MGVPKSHWPTFPLGAETAAPMNLSLRVAVAMDVSLRGATAAHNANALGVSAPFVTSACWFLIVLLSACSAPPPPPPPQAAPVSVAQVQRKTVPDLLTAIGSVEAINSVAVKSLVDGQLLDVYVKDGEAVHKGQLLFKIDPKPAQAALAQAQAAQAKDAAASDLAKAQVDRYKPVASKGFISADQMQQYQTSYAAAAASVKVDQANTAATRLTLGYTEISAPFDGRAGRVLVQAGNLVKANDTNALLVINQISPIFVSFSVPGSYVERIRVAQSKGALDVKAQGDSMKNTQSGELAFVDNAVDPATNTVKLRASFSNAGETLWPGQFINISLTLGTDSNALVVPDAAVKAGPNGNYVFVVKPDHHAEQRLVDVARSVGGETVITKGLEDNETVVIDGQSRVVDGGLVKVADQGDAKAVRPTADGQSAAKSGSSDDKRPDGSVGDLAEKSSEQRAQKSSGMSP